MSSSTTGVLVVVVMVVPAPVYFLLVTSSSVEALDVPLGKPTLRISPHIFASNDKLTLFCYAEGSVTNVATLCSMDICWCS